MAFAGKTGVTLDLTDLGGDPLAALFNEELGAVLQVPRGRREGILGAIKKAGLIRHAHVIGYTTPDDIVSIRYQGKELFYDARVNLQRAWFETTYQLQRLRDNPECAQQEYDAILDAADPGLSAKLSFDPADNITAPYIARGIRPRIAILREQGVNGQLEMAAGFDRAGFTAVDVTLSDVIDGRVSLTDFKGLAACGGFSYGDDTGSGKAYANKMKNHLKKELGDFVGRDKLVIGICNGFQILTNANLLPGALTFNDNARYTDRWVDIKITGNSPWLTSIKTLTLPIANGEGKYYLGAQGLKNLNKNGQIAARYVKGEICEYQNLKPNPNGAIMNIAAVSGFEGRVLGIMPHPERAMFFHHLPNWPVLKEKRLRGGENLPSFGPGLQIFKNGVNYFR
jgi:phosphoribosylformylglycinamidine synthase